MPPRKTTPEEMSEPETLPEPQREPDPIEAQLIQAGADIPARLALLRVPFPASSVGKLPRVTCKECSDRSLNCTKHQRATCNVCHAYVSTQHIHLDFVGHADVTNRLLLVDPLWNWEPLAWAQNGLPLFERDNSNRPIVLWIKLTVCGMTRLGVGDQAYSEKELIGDAIRNAAMRFGVALNLWTKTELEDVVAAEKTPERVEQAKVRYERVESKNRDLGAVQTMKAELSALPLALQQHVIEAMGKVGLPRLSQWNENDSGTIPIVMTMIEDARKAFPEDAARGAPPPDEDTKASTAPARPPGGVSEPRIREIREACERKGFKERADRIGFISAVIGREVESSRELTTQESNKVIRRLRDEPDAVPVERIE